MRGGQGREAWFSSLQRRLRYWYEGDSGVAHRFRYGLLLFDVLTILFIVGTSFVERTPAVEALDIVFGLTILADFTARLVVSRDRVRKPMRLGQHRELKLKVTTVGVHTSDSTPSNFAMHEGSSVQAMNNHPHRYTWPLVWLGCKATPAAMRDAN